MIARIKAIHKEIRAQANKKTFKKTSEEVLQDKIASLVLCEKLLTDVDFETLTTNIVVIRLRLKNCYLLVRSYFEASDYSRVIRFLSENTPSNMYVKDLLNKLTREPVLADCDI